MFNWKEFERVHSVIKLLRETSSSNAKASILKQYKDTPHLQDLLYYTDCRMSTKFFIFFKQFFK